MRALRAMDYSTGTAAELFKSVISFVLVMAANKLPSKLSDNELGIM